MNIKEFKEFLSQFPDDMEIIETMYSDYHWMHISSWSVVKAVPKGYYIMRTHPTMSEENKAKEREFLHFQGN